DDLEPGLWHLGRQRRVRERASQALHEHHVGLGADPRGSSVRPGAVRRVLRSSAGSRSAGDCGVVSMMTKTPQEQLAEVSAWWTTDIIDIQPGEIALRGYPIEELIGNVSFPDMVYLLLRGELPERSQAELLEAAMVASVDHGPHAPAIAISRMA